MTDFFSTKPVSTPWLESIGFTKQDGALKYIRVMSIGEHVLETYPEFTDREGNRRWYWCNDNQGKSIYPPPRNQGEVLLLLRRLGAKPTPLETTDLLTGKKGLLSFATQELKDDFLRHAAPVMESPDKEAAE